MVILPLFEALGNLSLYNYVKKLHIEILYLWVNIVILLDSKNEIKIFGVTAPLNDLIWALLDQNFDSGWPS